MTIIVARDIAIILLALESIVVLALLSILTIQVMRLVRLLREEVMPILRSTQDTVTTVRGTTDFMTDHLVQPVVKVTSYAAGAREAISVLFGRRNGRQ
jgi:hypothetical protein